MRHAAWPALQRQHVGGPRLGMKLPALTTTDCGMVISGPRLDMLAPAFNDYKLVSMIVLPAPKREQRWRLLTKVMGCRFNHKSVAAHPRLISCLECSRETADCFRPEAASQRREYWWFYGCPPSRFLVVARR